MTARIVTNDAVRKVSERLHALGGVGRPADVASMIVWLVDGEQQWVTGQVFGVDGGLATVKNLRN